MAQSREQRKNAERQEKTKGRNEYKGIVFAEGYNKTLEEFRTEFGENHIFARMSPMDREAGLVEAHKIATNGNTPPAATGSAKGK